MPKAYNVLTLGINKKEIGYVATFSHDATRL